MVKHCTIDQPGTGTCVFILVSSASTKRSLLLILISLFSPLQVRSRIPVGSVAAGSGPTTTSSDTRKNVQTDTREQSFNRMLSLQTVPVSYLTWSTGRYTCVPTTCPVHVSYHLQLFINTLPVSE